MRHGIHFISGLPRSGSTLLAAILRQNPRFYAAMTSPVGAMYMALEGAMSRRNETAVFITETQRRDLLKEGFFGEQARRMVLVEYEALAQAPLSTLRHLYTVLGEPHFEHDLDNVDYAADEFDMALGAPGLHTIRRKVEWVERQTVLPPEIFQRFENDAFWRRPDLNIRQVPLIRLD